MTKIEKKWCRKKEIAWVLNQIDLINISSFLSRFLFAVNSETMIKQKNNQKTDSCESSSTVEEGTWGSAGVLFLHEHFKPC